MILSSSISAVVVVVLVAGAGDISSSSRSQLDVCSLPQGVITRRRYPRCPADPSSLLLIANLVTLVTIFKPVCDADGIWPRIWVQQTITIGRVNRHSERLSVQNIFRSFMGTTSWLCLETRKYINSQACVRMSSSLHARSTLSTQNTAFMIVSFAAHSPSDAVADLPVILLGREAVVADERA